MDGGHGRARQKGGGYQAVQRGLAPEGARSIIGGREGGKVRRRWFPLLTAVLGGLLWVALGAILNTRPPTTGNQMLFVAVLGMALAATVMPVSYLWQTRRHGLLYMTPPWRNAVRQGALVGVLGAALVALRLVGALGIGSGVLLVLLAALCELLAWLRRRY